MPKIWLIVSKGITFRLFHIHTGFDDYSLLWIVDRKLYDLLFFRVR